MPSTDQKSYSEDLYNKRRGYESPNENRHYSYPDEEHGEDDSNAPVVVRIVLPVNLRVGCKIDVQIPRGGFLGGEEFELVIDPRQTYNYESEEEDSRIEQYSLEQRSQRSANSQNTYEEHSRHNANIRHSPEERSQRSTNSKYSVDEQLQRSANTGGNHRQQHMTRINDNGSEFKIEETPDKKKPPLSEVQQNGTATPIVSLYGLSGNLRSKEAPIQATRRSVLLARMTPQQRADLRALNQQKLDKLATALEIMKDNRADMGSALGTMNTTMNTMNTTMNNVFGFMNENSLIAKSVVASIDKFMDVMKVAIGFLNETNLSVKSLAASIVGCFNDQQELIFLEVEAEMRNAGTNQFDNANTPLVAPPVANANAPPVASILPCPSIQQQNRTTTPIEPRAPM